MKSNKKIILIVSVAFLIAGIAGWLVFRNLDQGEKEVLSSKVNLDAFAKCLTSKKAVMYGAYWCPHCQSQKKLFGDSFKYVNYVECTKDIKKCESKKINGYPTWIFANGKRMTGEKSLEILAKETSCKLPSL